MIILTIRTDNPQAEIRLYNNDNQLAYETWQGHRELSNTIHAKIKKLLEGQQKSWQEIEGVVCFKGPGSFTGLRIGLTVANTLANENSANIVGTNGEDWIQTGIAELLDGKNEKIVLPDYGRDPHITKQKR